MEIKILAADVQVANDAGRTLTLTARKGQAFTALVAAGGAVPTSMLREFLWSIPDEKNVALKSLIHKLRADLAELMGDGSLEPTPGGYKLMVHPGDYVDLKVFQRLTERAEQIGAGDPRVAAALYEYAVSLWAKPPLVHLGDNPGIEPLRRSLLNALLDVIERWYEVELLLGHHSKVAKGLETLTDQHPEREYLLVLRLRALDRGNRKPEALRIAEEHRDKMLKEMNSEPGSMVQQTVEQINFNDRMLAFKEPKENPADLAFAASGADPMRSAVACMTYYLLAPENSFGTWEHRAAVEILKAVEASVTNLSWHAAKFQARVTRELSKRSIRRFLVVCASLPTQYSPHEVLDLVTPGAAEVIYTLPDAGLVSHFRDRVGERDGVVVAEATLYDPATILNIPKVQEFIAAGEPVLVYSGEEHNYDKNAGALLAEIMDAMPAGSYASLVVGTGEGMSALVKTQLAAVYKLATIDTDTDMPLTLRSMEETSALCAEIGLELVDPITDTCAFWTSAPEPPGPFRAWGVVGVTLTDRSARQDQPRTTGSVTGPRTDI